MTPWSETDIAAMAVVSLHDIARARVQWTQDARTLQTVLDAA